MPEGDALRRAANRLGPVLVGEPLLVAELRWPDLAGANLVGRTTTEVVAVGKNLLMRFDDGRTLHTHLRMDGFWDVWPAGPVPRPRQRGPDPVRLVLGTQRHRVVGSWLGMMHLVPTSAEHTLLGHLGPDILDDDFPTTGLPVALGNLQRERDRQVGAALIDQRNLAGIGTIYMTESLFRHRRWPQDPVRTVTDLAEILESARLLMWRAVVGGPEQPRWAHSREGQPCPRCGTAIAVTRVGDAPYDRPAWYCPQCQGPSE